MEATGLGLVFYILAVISFGIATVAGDRVGGKVNLLALGLAFFVLGHVL